MNPRALCAWAAVPLPSAARITLTLKRTNFKWLS